MSNGELSQPKNPWAEIKLTPSTLLGAVAEKTAAVEDAQGDVKAANERLREVVAEGQGEVGSAEDTLSDRKQDVLEGLRGMALVGRTINFASGVTLGAVDFSEVDRPYQEPKSEGENLAGSGGTITDVEVGTFLGAPIEPADAVILLVDMDDGKGNLKYAGLPEYRYAVVADGADYTTGEAPTPEDQQDASR